MYAVTWSEIGGVHHAVACDSLATARFIRARLRPVFEARIWDCLLGREVE